MKIALAVAAIAAPISAKTVVTSEWQREVSGECLPPSKLAFDVDYKCSGAVLNTPRSGGWIVHFDDVEDEVDIGFSGKQRTATGFKVSYIWVNYEVYPAASGECNFVFKNKSVEGIRCTAVAADGTGPTIVFEAD